MDFESAFGKDKKSLNMFKSLRRLHGQNLESRGLHDMTEAFQSFVTRARFFSIGKLRRTWSHGAAEFVKYRRLLPMILANGRTLDGCETDDFDVTLAFQANQRDNRKIIVSNISPRVTSVQLQSFFSKFGKVANCSLPLEEKKTSVFGTLPKHVRNCGTGTISFKHVESADKAKAATSEDLKFYEQVMVVSSYVSKKRGGKGLVLADDSREDTPLSTLSRQSSTTSINSTMTSSSCEVLALESLPTRALELIVSFLPIVDTIRLERVSKKFMEVSIKSWEHINKIVIARESEGRRGFNKNRPLLNNHLKAILTRGGRYLKSLDLSGVVHLLNDKALDTVSSCCPGLIELDISGLHASSEALQELSEGLQNLQSLAFRRMETSGDKAFWFLLKSTGRTLKFVDFRNSKRLHGRCFQLLGPQLEQLYLDGSEKIDSMAFEDLCTNAAGLKELRINECYRITDENLSMISRRMLDLTAFTLCGDNFEFLSNEGMEYISHMVNVTELALDYNPLVTDSLLKKVCVSLKSLNSLSLVNSGDDASITPDGLSAIGALENLTQIDLSSIAAVNEASIKVIAASCKKLELIQLRNCTYLNDDGAQHLKTLVNLRHLDLSGSILISNDFVSEFIKAYPSLPKQSFVTIVVGGTASDASKLNVRGSRVVVDFSDYSEVLNITSSESKSNFKGSLSDNEDSDDDFETRTAQRSFYIDAVCGENDSPEAEDEKQIAEWAEREARNLGLIKD